MKRTLSILFLCVSIGLTLFTAEVVTRMFYKKTFSVVGWGEAIGPDDGLVFSFRPNQDIIWQRYGREMKFHTNNLGYRSEADTIVPKPANVFRILMAGDSFTFGDGVSNEYTIPYLLEKKLNEMGTDQQEIEVINMGVPGYSPDQTYRQLMRSVQLLKPDLIVWNFNSWLIEGMINNTGKKYYRSSLYLIEKDSLKHLDARRNKIFIRNRLFAYAPRMVKNSYLFDLVINRLFYTSLFSGIPDISREERLLWAQKKLALEIITLYEYAKENDSDFMFAVLPTLDSLSYETNGFIGNIKDLIHGHSSISFVDLNSMILAHDNETSRSEVSKIMSVLGVSSDAFEELFMNDNGHPNSKGTRLFAELLASYIHLCRY